MTITPNGGLKRLPEARTEALSAASFRLLVESVRDYAIFMLDPHGVVVSWNAGAERIKGYRADEIIGRHFSAFYRPEDIAAGLPQHELETAAADGRYEEEGWRIRKDGSRFRANVAVTALRDERGALAGFAKVTRDVTERWHATQALRESEERFRVLVEQIGDYAIFMLDPQGRITTWNLGAQRIKGYRSEEILGRHQSTFYSPEDQAAGKSARLLRKADEEGVARDIGWRVRKDGSRFWADVTLTALHDTAGNLYGFAKVTRDLTDRVMAEEQARAYAAAREAIRLRDDFLSIAAHELRTPLTAAQLHLQGLQRHIARNADRLDPQRIASGIGLALQSGNRLAQLIETLLDVSRISSSRIRLEPSEFDLVQATRELAGHLGETVAHAGCELRLYAAEPVHGCWDRLRVEQALINLISNACKYAAGTLIEVEVARQGERARLRVTDHGPGIAPENLERIFGRFERAASADSYGGLGLGLYVTRHIAEMHAGEVRVESRLGAGSTFTIDLPLWTPTK